MKPIEHPNYANLRAAAGDGEIGWGVFHDALLEYGFTDYAAHVRAGRKPPESLTGYDWESAFEYAGEKPMQDESGYRRRCYGEAKLDRCPPSDMDIHLLPFDRGDIRRVIAQEEGENDGPEWLCVGELWDGRYFFLHAGCDYTGWD